MRGAGGNEGKYLPPWPTANSEVKAMDPSVKDLLVPPRFLVEVMVESQIFAVLPVTCVRSFISTYDYKWKSLRPIFISTGRNAVQRFSFLTPEMVVNDCDHVEC